MIVLGATQQQRIGLWVVVVLTVGWLLYLITTARRTYEPGSELETAPNRKPYYDDDGLEGPRLTKYLWWAFATLAITAVALPLYWLREPFRQRGAGLDRGTAYFEHKSVERGRAAFQNSPGNPPTPHEPHFGCESCHGGEGVGGQTVYTLTDPSNPDAPPRQVTWEVPALNTVMLRYRRDEVRNIIVYGRAGTPMPGWGVEGGGALNDQQIEELLDYLEHIQLDPAEVKEQNLREYGLDGQRLFDGFCAYCHTLGYSYGEPGVSGGGAYGPPLTNGSTLRQFPTNDLHVEWVAKTAELGEQYGVRGISKGVMPHFEEVLTPEQIQAIVEYERGL